jgi:hypothetical protein
MCISRIRLEAPNCHTLAPLLKSEMPKPLLPQVNRVARTQRECQRHRYANLLAY